MPFELLPAVDLRLGRVVRLEQGDFDRERVYGTDPIAFALSLVEAGARWLHVVDLDRARDGGAGQAALVRKLVAAVGDRAAVEVAGGLRDEAAVADALASGARRAVIGTAALRDAGFTQRLVERHGAQRIAVALDVRDGLAVGDGWRAGAAGRPVEDAIDELAAAGVACFEVTAIERDGLLGGPDLELLRRLVVRGRGAIVASGGIATLDDLRRVRDLGCAGAILGRALYDGRLDLRSALELERPT